MAQADLEKDDITLLAPDDEALTPPRHREHEHSQDGHSETTTTAQFIESTMQEELLAQPITHPFKFIAHEMDAKSNFDEDDDRKARFAKIIGYLLRYHTLPFASNAHDLASSSTLPSTLQSGHDSEEPLRIRVAPTWNLRPLPHPSLQFNFYVNKRGPTIKARNGYIHLVSAPLLPPFSPLNTAFLFPPVFSSLTSGLQKVNLDAVVLPPTHEESNSVSMVQDIIDELIKENAGQWTVFAPTNFAFTRLGPKILALLHSPFPFSRKILKYVLAYHLVPDLAFYSDYIFNATNSVVLGEEINVEVDLSALLVQDVSSFGWDLPSNPGARRSDNPEGPHRANVTHYTLPTLLSTSGVNPNATLDVDVVSYRILGRGPIRRAVVVLPAKSSHDHDPEKKDGEERKRPCHRHEDAKPIVAWKSDVVARNGAIHAINTIIRPPYYHHPASSDDRMMRALQDLFA